jgi:hypothetical protein
MSRDNSADFDMYVNGANVGTVAQASGVMYSESIQILKRAVNSETCNGNIIRCAGFGASLSDAEYGDLYRIIASYMSRIDNDVGAIDHVTVATYAAIASAAISNPSIVIVTVDETNDNLRTHYFYDGATLFWLPAVEAV